MDGEDSSAFHLRLNSVGESSSDTSSPPSSVSSSETDAPQNVKKPPRRRRPPVRMQSLDGVVGACKRGRRLGRRNRTLAEREATAQQDQIIRNARERMRVQNVKHEYEQLRCALGRDASKRLTKLKTLEMAIQYIRDLTDELNRLQAETEEVPPFADGPGPSDGNYPIAAEPSGQVDMAGGYNANPRMMLYVQESQSGQLQPTSQSSPGISLSCDETMEPIEDSNSEQDPMVHSTTSPIPEVPTYPCSTSTTPPPEGMYFNLRCSEQVSSTPSSSVPAVMLAPSFTPGENSDLHYSPSLSTLQLMDSPELFQPMISLPLPSMTEPTVGYPNIREEVVETSQHPWAPLSCPPTLSHYDYPPNIFQS